MTNKLNYLIGRFDMKPHPEGGWYAETYRSTAVIDTSGLVHNFDGPRNVSTAILFLLGPGVFSAFHRIKSDEMWHFYQGNTLLVYVINEAGGLEIIRLGSNYDEGEVPQATVRAGCWFASKPADPEGYSFVGCTVAPGFDFADFEMAGRHNLSVAYPQHQGVIEMLTRV